MNTELGKRATDGLREDDALPQRETAQSAIFRNQSDHGVTTDKPPKPFRQGGLDSLCGIYAIINAIKRVAPYALADDEFACKLFRKMFEAAVRREGTISLIEGGLDGDELVHVAKTAIRYLKRHGFDFGLKRPVRGLHHFPYSRRLHAAWLARAATDPDISVILYVEKPAYSHWSVLKSVQGERVKLFDSDGMHAVSPDICEPWVLVQNLCRRPTSEMTGGTSQAKHIIRNDGVTCSSHVSGTKNINKNNGLRGW